jgi:hypothetical protein
MIVRGVYELQFCNKAPLVESFCPESTLSVHVFPNREQAENRQMRRSEDFLEEQDTRFMIEEQPGQDIEDLRIPR